MSYRLFFLAIILLLGGCSTDRYRNALIPKQKNKIISNPYGSYISLNTGSVVVAGELIAVNSDSVFILTEIDLEQFLIEDINSATITLTENNTKKYAIMTGVAATPALLGAVVHTDYSTQFMILAIPAVVFGGLAIFAASQQQPHTIEFPSKNLADIRETSIYARFPGGMPLGINRTTIKPIL